MSVQRVGEGRRGRGRSVKLDRLITDLYKEGKCRQCSVNVTRMDFAKILGKFTKVKIQYETTPRPSRVEKKITSPVSGSRLRSNENGMVLLHRSVYKEHPAKVALADSTTAPATPTPRKRGRPPKIKPVIAPPAVTRYRIIFCERRDSLCEQTASDEANIGDILPAVTSDILPTDEWLVDYLLQDEPTNDRVYDRIAAQLEDLMYEPKLGTPPAQPTSDSKTDDFPSIMELLSDTRPQPDAAQTQAEIPKVDGEIDKPTEESKTEVVKMEVDLFVPPLDCKNDSVETTLSDTGRPTEESANVARDTANFNGNMARVGDRNVDLQSINYIVFKRVKNDECNRIVKCSKNLDYTVEMDGRQVQLVGAPKYISCAEDLRLMLQIVHESDLSSCYVLEQR